MAALLLSKMLNTCGCVLLLLEGFKLIMPVELSTTATGEAAVFAASFLEMLLLVILVPGGSMVVLTARSLLAAAEM